jgi:hypothetical protein
MRQEHPNREQSRMRDREGLAAVIGAGILLERAEYDMRAQSEVLHTTGAK